MELSSPITIYMSRIIPEKVFTKLFPFGNRVDYCDDIIPVQVSGLDK